jgi:signal transduction histidine kinase
MGSEVLLIEDNPGDVGLVEAYLEEAQWPPGSVFATDDAAGADAAVTPELTHVDRLSALERAVSAATRVVLLDLNLPDSAGLETVDEALSVVEGVPVVVLTGLDDERIGIEAVGRGAQDYLVKDDLDARTLRRTLQYAIERDRQSRELRRRNEKLAVLTWVFRHELRDHLTVVVGRGRALDRHVDEAGRPFLEEVLEAGETAIDLTETVREFLDVVEGGADPRPVALAPALDRAVADARNRHPDLDVEVGEVPDVEVRGVELLASAFTNLLTDGVRRGGADAVSVAVDDDPGTVTVTVDDDGPAIPEEQQAAVFGADRPSGSPGTGAGVGLYLVDTVVDLCGGSVSVADREAGGVRFVVTLPRA